MSARKAVRVRKARHRGRCPVCGCWVVIGELIASVRGAPFMCISHVTRADTDGAQDTGIASADETLPLP